MILQVIKALAEATVKLISSFLVRNVIKQDSFKSRSTSLKGTKLTCMSRTKTTWVSFSSNVRPLRVNFNTKFRIGSHSVVWDNYTFLVFGLKSKIHDYLNQENNLSIMMVNFLPLVSR